MPLATTASSMPRPQLSVRLPAMELARLQSGPYLAQVRFSSCLFGLASSEEYLHADATQPATGTPSRSFLSFPSMSCELSG